MTRPKVIPYLICFLLTVFVVSGCATKNVVYRRADPNTQVVLPRDNFAHRNYRTEWWYFTGHLTADNGHEYAFEVTFFKRRTDEDKYRGLPIRNYSNPAHMAHFAIIDETAGTHRFEERRSKDYINNNGKGGTLEDKLYLWNDDWSLKQIGSDWLLRAGMKGYDLTLMLTPQKPPVLHGDNGYMAKGDQIGQGTHYFSYTNIRAEGVLFVDGSPLKVSGRAWHDHEYGSYQMASEYRGWDWFSIRLDNDAEIMIYLLTLKQGGIDSTSSGTIVPASGEPVHLNFDDFNVEVLDHWTSRKTETTYPSAWKITIPAYETELSVTPYILNQEMRTKKTLIQYWEGSAKVSGTYQGQPISGKAFVELTGYIEPLKYLTKRDVQEAGV